MNKTISKIIITAQLLLVAFSEAGAQAVNVKEGLSDTYYTIMLIVCVILFNLIFIPLMFGDEEGKAETQTVVKRSLFKVLKDKLSGTTPIEQEDTILLEDDFDGIRELDNKVPPWFNILFYGTIIFAMIYLVYYHVFSMGRLPAQEYSDEMYEAQLIREEMIRTGAFINENNVVLLTDPESIKKGEEIFSINCTPCHGMKGEGTVGPNLTDEYWIHGGGVKNVFKTVRYGVPVKGMIAWQTQLNPKKMQEVVSYVLTLQGTNPPNGKIAEGEKYVEQDSLKDLNKDTLKTNDTK